MEEGTVEGKEMCGYQCDVSYYVVSSSQAFEISKSHSEYKVNTGCYVQLLHVQWTCTNPLGITIPYYDSNDSDGNRS